MRIEDHYQLWFDALLECWDDDGSDASEFFDLWSEEIMQFASGGAAPTFSH